MARELNKKNATAWFVREEGSRVKDIITQSVVENPGMGASHRYKSDKGEISLVYPIYYTQNMFEIYSIKGELFDDVERYESLNEAEDRINELL